MVAQLRLAVSGTVQLVPDEERQTVRLAYLQKNPKAKLYIDFKDMAFWRLQPQHGSYFAGFGRAYRLCKDDLAKTPIERGDDRA